MIHLLMVPFLTDTVIVPPPDFQDVYVHEWGIVVFSAEGAFATVAPDEEGNLACGRDPYGPLLVDAPVVWIHGAQFQEATFTVSARRGWITMHYPDADTVDGEYGHSSASWRISSPPPYPMRERPTPPPSEGLPFAWAMDFWREVPSRDLYSSETGEYIGNFLYYETRIPDWEPPFGYDDPMILAGHYSPEGLLIGTGDEPVVEWVGLVPLPDGTGAAPQGGGLDDDQVLEILCGWGGGRLKSSEISALWATWKPFFRTEADDDAPVSDRRGSGERWVLFPLPHDETEKISSISLHILDERRREVHYRRLFLGLARVL